MKLSPLSEIIAYLLLYIHKHIHCTHIRVHTYTNARSTHTCTLTPNYCFPKSYHLFPTRVQNFTPRPHTHTHNILTCTHTHSPTHIYTHAAHPHPHCFLKIFISTRIDNTADTIPCMWWGSMTLPRSTSTSHATFTWHVKNSHAPYPSSSYITSAHILIPM